MADAMITAQKRHTALTLVGLSSLAIYVLACVSFSPDDTKILYPSLGRKPGETAISAYHRKSGTTEKIFSRSGFGTPSNERVLLRPQWTPDGKQAVILWGGDDKQINVALIPMGNKGPVRFQIATGIEDAMERLVLPLPIVGHGLFLGGKSLLRLDLDTGKILTNQIPGEIYLYPSARGNRLFYLLDPKEQNQGYEFGQVESDTLALSPTAQLKKEQSGELSFLAVSPDGSRLAVASKRDDKYSVLVYRGSQLEKTLPIAGLGGTIALGNLQWSPKGTTIYAAFEVAEEGRAEVTLGALELPIDGTSPRRIPLLHLARSRDESDLLVFQLSLSHKGDALAACSTYVALNNITQQPEDAALYIVNLSSSQRSITKVPILPAD